MLQIVCFSGSSRILWCPVLGFIFVQLKNPDSLKRSFPTKRCEECVSKRGLGLIDMEFPFILAFIDRAAGYWNEQKVTTVQVFLFWARPNILNSNYVVWSVLECQAAIWGHTFRKWKRWQKAILYFGGHKPVCTKTLPASLPYCSKAELQIS